MIASNLRRRRALLAGVLLWAFAPAVLSADNGPVLVVRSSDLPPYVAVQKAFSDRLGRGVQTLSVNADRARLSGALTANPSLVLAIGPEAARTVAASGTSAPVLFALVPAPDGIGGKTPARTIPMFVPPQGQISVVKQLLPKANALGVIYDPSQSAQLADGYTRAAKAAGIQVMTTEVSSRKQVAAAVRGMVGKVDALWLLPDPTVIGVETIKFMVETSLESKLPLIGFSQGMSRAGALVSIEADYTQIGEAAAAAGKRLLAGGATGDEAASGTVYLNGRTAEILNIAIPATVRQRAKATF